MKQKLLNSIKLRATLLVAMLCAVCTGAWADTKTVNAGTLSSFVLTDSPFTLTFAKNNGGTDPTYNSTGGDNRLYAKGTVTVTIASGSMTTIVFNLSAQGKKRLAPITASVGTISTQSSGDETVTWTGNAAVVTFTVGDKADYGSDGSSKAGQLCFGSVDFTYTTSSGPVDLTDAAFAWSAASYTATFGGSNTFPTLTNTNNLVVTYGSSNTSVATIASDGTISLLATGTTTISAVFAGNGSYNAKTVSYTLTVKRNNSISSVADSYTLDIASVGGSVNLSGAAADHGLLNSEIVTASTTVDASYYSWESQVLTVEEGGNGTIVIRFWVDEDEDYNAVELITTVTVKADPIIGYDGATDDTPYGTPYEIDTYLIDGGDITVSSSNTAVATVSGLTITPVAVGSTTITINTAAASIWNAGSGTFTLNVTAPEGKETATTDNVITTTFTDKDLNSEGGIDWTASIDANAFESANPARGVQFGAAKGEFTLTATGSNVYKVSMEMSTNGTGNTIGVSVGGNTFTTTYGVEEGDDPISNLTLTSGMRNATVEFTGDAGNAVTISVDDANKSVYFKSITLYEVAVPITATLNASGYATFCSEYPLDFSGATDYSAWQITGISGTTITFSQVEGKVKGGTGLLLKGTAGATVTIPSADSENTLSSNKLYGTLVPTYVAADTYYGLSGASFVKVNAGTVPAGKALLPAGEVPSSVKSFTFVFDGADGIQRIEKVNAQEAEAIFNLAGQRVNKAQNGIFIVNGKKVVK